MKYTPWIKKYPYKNEVKLPLFITIFGMVGAFALVRSFAAVSANAKITEAEAYASTLNTTIVNDMSTSGSSYIQFDAVSVSPPSASGFCDTFPSLPASKPDATNTGVPSGTSLSAYTGPTSITAAGTVIDGRDITQTLTINAPNVTIRNSKIHPGSGSATKGIILNSTGTKILNSEIYTSGGGYVGIDGSDAVVCGNYLHGWENAMTVGGNMTIQANYIDKLAAAQSGPHYDGIEIYYGGDSKIWGNNIRLTSPSGSWLDDTGAINLTAWTVNIDNVEMNGNWLGGGGYSIYVDEQSGKQATNVVITNNTWYRDSYLWGTHLIRDNSSVTAWTGNIFDDNGQVLAK